MESFRDVNGKEHEVPIHLGTIERIRDETGVNVLEWGMASKDEDPTSTLLFRFRSEPILLANIVWAAVRSQKATEDERFDFMAALQGQALWDARVALEENTISFTRGPEQNRLRKVRETLGKLMDTILMEQNNLIANPKTDQLLNNAVEKLKGTFGEWLESAESTLTDSATVNS